MTTPIYTLYDVLTIAGANVGIGTTLPSSAFQVVGAVTLDGLKSTTGFINVFGGSLCNVQKIDVAELLIGGAPLPFSGSDLTNLTNVLTSNVRTDTLSNLYGSAINVTGSTLSNVGAISVEKITAFGPNVNLDSKTLSNVSGLQSTYVSTELLTSATAAIGVSGKSLCNVDAFVGKTLTATTATLSNITSTFPYLDVSGKSLSNIPTVFAGVVNTGLLTSLTDSIGVSGKSLCNVDAFVGTKVTANTITTSTINSTDAAINVSGISLCNVNDLSANAAYINLALINTITSITGDSIRFSYKTLCNITKVVSDTINTTTTTLSNITSTGSYIDMSGKSLSNISTVFTPTVSTDSITSSGSSISLNSKSLSSVNDINTATLTATTATLASITATANHVNVSGKSLSNVSTVFATTLSSGTLSTVGNAVIGGALSTVGDAVIGGTLFASNLQVVGDFTTMNTTTSNTEQMVITNIGTGPALKVTQAGSGAEFSVAEFYDAEDGISMRIMDTGLIGIGTSVVASRLGVSGGVTVGSAYNAIAAPTNGLLVSGDMGVGTSTPSAKLDVNGAFNVGGVSKQKMGGMRFIQALASSNYDVIGDHSIGLTATWANTKTAAADQIYAFKVNTKLHFTSETNSTFSTIEAVITPVDSNPKPNGLLIGAPQTSSLNTNNFKNIALTATRASANSVDLRANFQANLTPSTALMFVEIVAPDALGDFTLTPL